MSSNNTTLAFPSSILTPPVALEEPVRPPAPPRAAHKEKLLPEGYWYTEKYGEVFINAGVAWVIKEMPNGELRSVSVTLTMQDIIKMPKTEIRKQSMLRQQRRMRQRGRTSALNQPFGRGKDGKQGLLAGVK